MLLCRSSFLTSVLSALIILPFSFKINHIISQKSIYIFVILSQSVIFMLILVNFSYFPKKGLRDFIPNHHEGPFSNVNLFPFIFLRLSVPVPSLYPIRQHRGSYQDHSQEKIPSSANYYKGISYSTVEKAD